MEQRLHKKWQLLILVFINIICIAFLVFLFIIYDKDYNTRLTKQNINDILHLNESSINIATAYIFDLEERLALYSDYIDNNNLSYTEACQFLYDNNTNGKYVFQIVNQSGMGYQLTKDSNASFIPVDYTNGDYKSLNTIFANPVIGPRVMLTPEFTDNVSRLKSIASYTQNRLLNDSGEYENYTLMLIIRNSDFREVIQPVGGYEKISVTITNNKGDYIIGNPSFKSDNFFKYIKVFNSLTLEETNALKLKVANEKRGYFYNKDYAGNHCIFAYERFKNSDWYSITQVPVSSFIYTEPSHVYTYTGIVVVLFLLIFDILYLKMLNTRLKKSAKAELDASNAKSDFLSRMSHDIRTPLNGIIGMAHLAEEETENMDVVQDYLKDIDLSSNFLLGLVNDILDVSKIEKGMMVIHPEPYNYNEFKKYIVAVFEPLCEEKNIDFTITSGSNLPIIMIDKLRINQVCFNLLSNSVKYTHTGGHVSLSVTVSPVNDSTSELIIVVSDDGVGMSKEFQSHMFEAFAQETSNKYIRREGGSGLGLSIVYGFVNLMGGTIEVDSTEGIGTEMTIRLNVKVDETASAEETLNVTYAEDFLRGKHILLVEDNRINMTIGKKLLDKVQAEIETAQNGQEAVDMVIASSENYYSAILMDINMPVMDGYTATKVIRALDRKDVKKMPIIAMTANAYTEDINNALEAGMNFHVPKPIDSNILYKTLYQSLYNN